MIEEVLRDRPDVMTSPEIAAELRKRFGNINPKSVYALLAYGTRKERIARLPLISKKGPHPQYAYHFQ